MNEIDQLIEGMSEQELQTIMNTQFPEELEKQAEAAVASSDLGEALFAYGAFLADRECAELSADGELAKEASEGFAAAEAELTALVDAGVAAAEVTSVEDAADLHKQAQAAAAMMLEGYITQFEKVASADPATGAGAPEGRMAKLRKALAERAEKVRAHVGAHKGKYSAGAGAAGGALLAAGAMKAHEKWKAKKGMEKKASELSVDELADSVFERIAEVEVCHEGIQKIADGAEKGAETLMEKIRRHGKALKDSKAVKHVGAHAGKYGLGAGAAGGLAAGYMLGKRKKED